MNRLFSILFIGFFVISSVMLMPVAAIIRLVTQPFDPKLKALHMFSSFWGALYTWCNPAWNVTVIGREKVDRKQVYVIVSNHQSLVDILAAYRLFIHFKWVAKEELFRAPVIGWNMSLNRYIRIRRGALESIRQMMKDCRQVLNEGSSIFLFPEGTRSETGGVGKFRVGAFTLAKEESVPILPIVINGSLDALPKGKRVIRGKHRITVKILDEIPTGEFEHQTTKTLAEYVRGRIVAELEKMNAQPPGKEL